MNDAWLRRCVFHRHSHSSKSSGHSSSHRLSRGHSRCSLDRRHNRGLRQCSLNPRRNCVRVGRLNKKVVERKNLVVRSICLK